MTAPEFSRLHPVRSVHAEPVDVAIEASASERQALAKRFDLLSLSRLDAEMTLKAAEAGIAASGTVRAEAEQSCVVTGDPVPARIDETFALLFVPESAWPQSGEEEIALDDDDCDIVFFAGDMIDLGETVAQTLALALDPFPRAADADRAARAAGISSEEQAKPAGPFAALAKLRDDTDDAAS